MSNDAPLPSPASQISGLGIAAIAIGIFAVALSWFPALGVLAIPIAILALIVAIVGLVVARAGNRNGIGLPIFGAIIAGLAILIAFFVMGGSLAGIRKGFDDYEHSRKAIHQSSQLTVPTAREIIRK